LGRVCHVLLRKSRELRIAFATLLLVFCLLSCKSSFGFVFFSAQQYNIYSFKKQGKNVKIKNTLSLIIEVAFVRAVVSKAFTPDLILLLSTL